MKVVLHQGTGSVLKSKKAAWLSVMVHGNSVKFETCAKTCELC